MKTITYKDAGVDIDAGNDLVSRIRPHAKATQRKEVISGPGGFAALFEIPLEKYKRPVLVSGTDGVGTKLKLAIDLKQYDTIGIDLVAMCVNDLITLGAEPLYFLDYYATAKLDVDVAEAVIAGIAQGCKQSGAALTGGETAEMPGMYQAGDFDLAGFCVGIVDKPKIIDGSQVKAGDVLIGLASSGIHSNGYSLVRKILETKNISLNMPFEGKTLGEHLLIPTKIYAKQILTLLEQVPVKAISHITGGGIIENLPRVLPEFTQANIQTQSWQQPALFEWLQTQANLDQTNMMTTFNCGVGMILCIAQEDATQAVALLNSLGEQAWIIGNISASAEQTPAVNLV